MIVKCLNLYAGIGGNRELWTGCDVTAVEYDTAIADVYAKRFPQDTTITGDALEYVQRHYSEFDFIWASPPCPTHGQYRHNVGVIGKGFDPVIPEMTSLYGLIVFLQTYYKGKWVVENVKPYYTPLIVPAFELQRHLFWANFTAPQRTFSRAEIRTKNKISDFDDAALVKSSRITNKRQVLRNCVDAELGLHIWEAANAEAHGRAVAHSIQVTAPARCADIGRPTGDCQEIRNALPDNITTPAQPETASGACQSARKGVT